MDQRAVAFTLGIIVLSLGTIYWISQWELPLVQQTLNGSPEWVLMQPQKCAEIPWRKDWSLKNGKPYDEFPLTSEISLLKAYYSAKGITILDATFTYQSTNDACHSCGCPEPFVFALYVNQTDAARLSISGFTILDNSNPYIFTGPLFRQSATQPVSVVLSAECEQLFSTNTALDQLLGSKKDSCYVQAAISARDISLCEKISTEGAQNTCISEVAVARRDASLCETISAKTSSAYASCISGVAGITQNAGLCARIPETSARTWCELGATPK